jgi:CRISPR-associated endonuclease Cas1
MKRLVIVGHSGTITLEALRWLHGIGTSFIQIDADGELIVASGPGGAEDVRLRRAQALAIGNEVGIAIMRVLLAAKLDGQREVATRLPNADIAIRAIEHFGNDLANAASLDQLRLVESQAASAYWAVWAPVSMRFVNRDAARIPIHWKTFGTRSSAITRNPRAATNPINALLNYAYAILETEVRIATLAAGLDPGMGILHADTKGRDSFVFDVIEPLRPVVDGHVLTLLEQRSFAAREFFETPQGICRLMPPLPQALAEMGPRLAKLAHPVVDQVARHLLGQTGIMQTLVSIPRSATQPERRIRGTKSRNRFGYLDVPPACRECGVILEDPLREYCDDCFPTYREQQAADSLSSGRQTLRALRAQGQDPSQTDAALAKRRDTMQRRKQEEQEWDALHGQETVDPAQFVREILPDLKDFSLSVLAARTGLSQQYCSEIRRGLYIPHPRHWEALRKAVKLSDESN